MEDGTVDVGTAEGGTSFRDRLELVLAMMLGMAAIVTAWTAFQSSQLGDKVQESYSEGIRTSDQASQVYNDATASDNQDTALFLEFAKASVANDEATAAYIHDTLMSPELRSAVDWWAEQPNELGYESPFVPENPNWTNALYEQAAALDVQAQESFDQAKKADNDGDEFDLLSVVVSLALFLFGIASLVRQQRIMVGLAGVGAVILVYSIIKMIILGDPGGVF